MQWKGLTMSDTGVFIIGSTVMAMGLSLNAATT
jgi:hypothetical protein